MIYTLYIVVYGIRIITLLSITIMSHPAEHRGLMNSIPSR